MLKNNKLQQLIFGLLINTALFAQGHGHNFHNGRSHYEDWPDSLETITVSGTVSVDTSNLKRFYDLETNNDDSTDYTLGLGPWWYEPVSGAVRPADGDEITIKGGLNNNMVPGMLVVYEIDGLVWRDPIGIPPWSGGWIYNNSNDTTWVFCPTDSLNYIGFPPAIMNGMMGNMGSTWPDSVYCQFEQIHIDSLPTPLNQDIFDAYLCNFNIESGEHFNMMGLYNNQNIRQGMMNFDRQIYFQFHYDDEVLTTNGMDENSIRLFYLNNEENWIEATNIYLDFENNMITLKNTDVAEFYALHATTNKAGTDNESIANVPSIISIDSAYPNPFNPTVKIEYSVSQSTNVKMQIFDISGNFINEIVNENMNPGNYSIYWNGTNSLGQNSSSGTYLIKVFSGNNVTSKKITLLR